MTFGTGANWNGNKNGRPKGSGDLRNKLGKELALHVKGDTLDIVYRLIEHAKADEQWAIKLYINAVLPYVLGKPKPEIEEEADDMKHAEAVNHLAKLSDKKLLRIRDIIEEEE